MSPFPTGVHYDIPVVDGDGMGRAYPTMYHGKFDRFYRIIRTSMTRCTDFFLEATFYVYGNPITPCCLSDAKGNTSVIMVKHLLFSHTELFLKLFAASGRPTPCREVTSYDGNRTWVRVRRMC
jgi:DUF917 family protein